MVIRSIWQAVFRKLATFLLLVPVVAQASALQFFGFGENDVDRVKIPVDDPANNNPGPPVDVGAEDFTIEFWIRTTDTAPAVQCNAEAGTWIEGRMVLDRDRHTQDRAFGISIAGGRVVFAVRGPDSGPVIDDRTVQICSTTTVTDNQWHPVAVQRRRSDGQMSIFVDGMLESQMIGPAGDVSYPDDGVPGNFCGGPCDFSDPFIVIGAEKHDAGAAYPSFIGFFDELRISNTLRYSNSGYTPQTTLFEPDGNTVGLYHFDQGTGNDILDASGFGTNGIRRLGGSPAGPQWVSDTPINGEPWQPPGGANSNNADSGGGGGALFWLSLPLLLLMRRQISQ